MGKKVETRRLEDAREKKAAEAKAAKEAAAELAQVEGQYTLMRFQFRPLANGDKLQLVFEADWKSVHAGTLDKLGGLAKKLVDLTFKECPEQPGVPDGEEPGQEHLFDSKGKPIPDAVPSNKEGGDPKIG
jgi:hypothetical protein